MLKFAQGLAPKLSSAASYSKSVIMMVGGLALLANLIGFVQLISLYTFMQVKFPENLKIVLRTFYTSLNIQVLPL
jgi:hypothetical protein